MGNAVGSVLDALADPTRRSVFEIVARTPTSVAGIAAKLPVSRPAVSQHLRVLLEAQLVYVTALGRERVYSLDQRGVASVRSYFEQFWTDALAAFTEAADAAADDRSNR